MGNIFITFNLTNADTHLHVRQSVIMELYPQIAKHVLLQVILDGCMTHLQKRNLFLQKNIEFVGK